MVPPPPAVTPLDTSARTLIVTVGITEDQEATDGMSKISLQFRTHVVEEDNYVRFHDRQTVTCNGVNTNLADSPVYTLSVARGNYSCSYRGHAPGSGLLAPVTMINVAAGSTLAPSQPSVTSKGYHIRYTPDAKGFACPIRADATDGSGHVVQGPVSLSDQGVYNGPATDSLTGTGTVILKRTCSWTLHGAFDTVKLTYESTASITVTWGH
jgi:hypothetical protein